MFRIPYLLHKMRLVHYLQLCLIEGLIFYHFNAFKTGIFRVRMHDFSMLPFYSLRTVSSTFKKTCLHN